LMNGLRRANCPPQCPGMQGFGIQKRTSTIKPGHSVLEATCVHKSGISGLKIVRYTPSLTRKTRLESGNK
jgi:hypothetical protein